MNTDRYLSGTRLRLRCVDYQNNGACELKLTQKVPAARPGYVQGLITNIYLSAAEYGLLALLPGQVLFKTRLSVPPLGIDVFDPPLHGLVLAEAEFSTEQAARAFIPPQAVAIGVWGASAGVGIALGPIAGGWLLERFWWGAIFAAMVPVAVLVVALAAWWVPTSRDPRTPPVDWRGFALSTVGMSLIVYGIIQAPGWGWASAATLSVLSAGVAVLGVLVAAERRTASPMIDVSLFRNPRFTAASGSVAISFFALLGFIFLMTQYFQVVRAYSPLSTGVRLLPVAVTVAAAAVAGTRLAIRIGTKVIVGGGMLFFCAALLWDTTFSQATSYGIIAASMVVLGIGMGFTQAPATEAIMGAVPTEKAGIASAVNGSTRLFGGTLGVAVIGSVAASLYTSRLAVLLPAGLPAPAVTAAHGSVGGAAAAAGQLSRAGLPGAAHALRDAAVLAFMHSVTGACLVAAAAAGAGVLLALTLLPNRPRVQQAGADRGIVRHQHGTAPAVTRADLAPRHGESID